MIWLVRNCSNRKSLGQRDFSPRLRRGVALREATSTGMVTDPRAEPGAELRCIIAYAFGFSNTQRVTIPQLSLKYRHDAGKNVR